MNKIYSIFLLIALPALTMGQISLDATMAPPLNSMLIYYDANVPSPPFTFGKSGTTNTWDFSALTPVTGAEDTVFYFSPSDFPDGSSFPSATHATYEGGDNSVNMLTIDANGLTFLGFIGDPIGTGTTSPFFITPPVTGMTFPYTYGSATNATTYIEIFTTGAAIGQPTIDSVRYKGTLNIDASVIASGDMILPSGTMPALLERQINNSVDTAWAKGLITGNQWIIAPGFPTTSLDSSFYWYSDQSTEHYAHALYDSTGLHDVHYFMTQVITGINDPVSQSKKLNAYPNPTHDFLGINGLNLPAATEWTIYNSAGSEVLKGNYNLGNLNVQNLKQGTYILRLKSVNGETHQVRFIKY
jgi:hypothetical protein